MNQKLRILYTVLGMMTLMSSTLFAHSSTDTLLLHRIWNYNSRYAQSIKGTEQNVYTVYSFSAKKRNLLLFFIPNMYTIASGNKEFIGETYNRLNFRTFSDYDLKRQVVCGTLPHNRNVMPSLLQYMTPDLYAETLYPERLLSPFHKANHHYYRFKVSQSGPSLAYITFTPRIKNTQLIKGRAVVDTATGRIQSVFFEGEFDMVKFKVSALMNQHDIHLALPERCITESKFKFMGNDITAKFYAYYNCPTTLPDSIDGWNDRALMARLRPVPLEKDEKEIYRNHDTKLLEKQRKHHQQEAETAATDTLQNSHHNMLKDIDWESIGDNLVNSLHANSGGFSMRISPLFNPLYLSYSQSRGISYRLNIGARYKWKNNKTLSLNPQLGYNFKLKQFYYETPLRLTYAPKHHGYVELLWGNGNRISSAALTDVIQQQLGEDTDVPEFKDEYFRIGHNIKAAKWLGILTGIVYHRRESTGKKIMHDTGLPEEFRSFSPMATLRLSPWKRGPVLTANYERSFEHVLQSNLSYERWEFDAAYKRKMSSMRLLNLRGGAGFYTRRGSNYFVDYTNFHDNNLPTGWDDEWTGQFQLVDSRWYNESKYYIRCHASYDSPLLILSRLPLVGRYIENERLYFSALSIEHTRPYTEIGYGFTNRFFSTGIFASFLGPQFHEFECKLTIEMFSRW